MAKAFRKMQATRDKRIALWDGVKSKQGTKRPGSMKKKSKSMGVNK
jgi:hypothetical protein